MVWIFALGISSGLPFLLTLATLHVRLVEAQASNALIGLFTLITIPYSLKFLWAPVVDMVKIPYLTNNLGQRRAWLLVSQIALFLSITSLGLADPNDNMYATAFFGFLVAICSATQDIVYEAYRTEILHKNELGIGATSSMLGYRIGIWLSGAGALYLADFFGWIISFTTMALLVFIGIITTLSCNEPAVSSHRKGSFNFMVSIMDIKQAAKNIINRESVALILLYVFFYKFGDTTLNVMTAPFLMDIGFSKSEIANVAKSFGIGTMIFGSFIGSFILSKRPLSVALITCAILHVFSCVMFGIQAYVGYSMSLLIFTIAIENLTCGLGTASLIAYFSSLSKAPFTATHYALLSSCASLFRIIISNLLGLLADHFSWEEFYMLAGLLCLPSFFLVIAFFDRFSLMNREKEQGLVSD